MIYLIIFAAVVFVLFTLNHGQNAASPGGSRRGSRRAFDQADELIMQAEGYMMRGQHDAAFSAYSRVPALAQQSGCWLHEAEAYYGMGRIAIDRGDVPAACGHLRSALANRARWEGDKPNFARLIDRELADWTKRLPK